MGAHVDDRTRAFANAYPFASQFFETGAGRMHYLDEGPKAAHSIVMLHGNPTWSFYYRRLVLAFRDRFRVIAPDHIGCGLSDKPRDFPYTLESHIANVEALLAHLEITRATFVLHDWGGAIGMGVATRHPDLAERFVISNTAAFRSDRMPLSLALCRLPGLGAVAIRGFNAFARVAFTRCIEHRERLTDEIRAGYLGPYDSWENRIAHLRFVEDIPMRPSHRSHETLRRIEEDLIHLAGHPMLIAWGGKDFVFDANFFSAWKVRFPDAEAHFFADAGHYVLEDAHERIVPLVEQFLRRES